MKFYSPMTSNQTSWRLICNDDEQGVIIITIIVNVPVHDVMNEFLVSRIFVFCHF